LSNNTLTAPSRTPSPCALSSCPRTSAPSTSMPVSLASAPSSSSARALSTCALNSGLASQRQIVLSLTEASTAISLTDRPQARPGPPTSDALFLPPEAIGRLPQLFMPACPGRPLASLIRSPDGSGGPRVAWGQARALARQLDVEVGIAPQLQHQQV